MREAERLEALWSGEFGDAYTKRNCGNFNLRKDWWIRICTELKPQSVLEVGCNIGGNLKWIEPHTEAYGVDVNRSALRKARIVRPSLNVVYAKGRELPFRDGYFDLVFTCGVLIHQPWESLKQVMAEVVRCSRRYVLSMEYHATTRQEVPYRDQEGSLFRDDYGGVYSRELGLALIETGRLEAQDGFDDLTYHILEKV